MTDQPKAERVFKTRGMVLLIVLFAISLALFGPATALAVLSWAAFFMLIANVNKNMRRDAALILAVQDYVLRVRDFLYDNPWVSANDMIRRQLLPTAEEVETMSFHDSFLEDFDEFREGKGWLMGGGVRAGVTPNLGIRPESEMIRILEKKLGQLREENIELKIKLQRGAQQVAEDSREYDV